MAIKIVEDLGGRITRNRYSINFSDCMFSRIFQNFLNFQRKNAIEKAGYYQNSTLNNIVPDISKIASKKGKKNHENTEFIYIVKKDD